MKKIITIIFCLLVSTTMAFAQHLKFMGVPMQGTIDDFCAELRAKGFVDEDVENNGEMSVRMKGNFYGEERVIDIYCTPITHKPYRVDIELDIPPIEVEKTKTITKTNYVPKEEFVQKTIVNQFGFKEDVYVKELVYKKIVTQEKVSDERANRRIREEKFKQKYANLIQSLKPVFNPVSNKIGVWLDVSYKCKWWDNSATLHYIDQINEEWFEEETRTQKLKAEEEDRNNTLFEIIPYI